jgi:hypothetical protein
MLMTSTKIFNLQLREIIKKIRSSSTRRQDWLATESLSKKLEDKDAEEVLMLILDVVTRWSSTYHMLERALDFKEELIKFMEKYEFSVEIDDLDWTVIEIVRDWLRIFQEATLQMSTTSKPMLSEVLGIYAGLQVHLKNLVSKYPESLDPCLRSSLVDAHQKLAKYRRYALENYHYYWAVCEFTLSYGMVLYLICLSLSIGSTVQRILLPLKPFRRCRYRSLPTS